MQDKISAAIAAYLEGNTFLDTEDIYSPFITFGNMEYPTPTHTDFCQKIAREITAAIMPLVEPGKPGDSKYTDGFLKWRKKYFKEQTETTYFVSKYSNERVSSEDLEVRYTRALRENPLQ